MVTKTEEKKKKKKWMSIFASEEFNKVKIGESLVGSPDELINKHLAINLMILTNDPKKQNANALFKVKEVNGETGVAELIGYALNNSYIRRLVRKGAEKIEDSIEVKTKDEIRFKIKPIFITRHKTKRSVLKALRKGSRIFLTDLFSKTDAKSLFLLLASNKLQIELKNHLRKVYPIAVSEIRILRKL